MAVRYALASHPHALVNVAPVADSAHPLGLFTLVARSKGDVMPFVTGQVSMGARDGLARDYVPNRPRDAQHLRWLLGPLRFAWASCTPNCTVRDLPNRYCTCSHGVTLKIDVDWQPSAGAQGARPAAAKLRAIRDIPAGAQLVTNLEPEYFGELYFEVQCTCTHD